MSLLSGYALRRLLAQGVPLLCDGAMGSELIRRGVAPQRILCQNRENPDQILQIHERYLSAGARILTANTFGYLDGAPIGEFVRSGILIAEKAASAATTPIGVWLSLTSAFVRYETPCLELILPGRMALIETCATLKQAQEATRIAKSLRPTLLAVTCHFRSEGTLPDGTTPEAVAEALMQEGADIVGANCGDNPQSLISVTRRLAKATSLPILVQPSAGLPKENTLGEWSYPVGASEFADALCRIRDAGAHIVGGCCGTTPEHIRNAYQLCFEEGIRTK